jgi:hypothetical protein
MVLERASHAPLFDGLPHTGVYYRSSALATELDSNQGAIREKTAADVIQCYSDIQ